MSDYITGELVRVGTYSEAEQPFGETMLACAVVVMDREQLKLVRALPMYDRVAIIRTAELEQLESENAKLQNELARVNGKTQWQCTCGGTDCAGQRENAALREALEFAALAYDDEQALFELSRRLYDVSCVARKALGKEAQP